MLVTMLLQRIATRRELQLSVHQLAREMFLTWLLMWKKEGRRCVQTKVFKTENTDYRKREVEYIGLEKGSFILAHLTWLHRDTWKMFPSLPPQNRKYSQGSAVTDIISTSNRTESSSSPEDNSHTWARKHRQEMLNPWRLSLPLVVRWTFKRLTVPSWVISISS